MRFQELTRWIIPAMWAYVVYSELFMATHSHTLVLGNISFVLLIASVMWAARKIPDYVLLATTSVVALSASAFCIAWGKPAWLWLPCSISCAVGFWLAKQEYKRYVAFIGGRNE